MIHSLKILPEHFYPVVSDLKRAELRKNDREFSEGDYLELKEYIPGVGFTGNLVVRKIIHVADVGAYLPGFVLLSMEKLDD